VPYGQYDVQSLGFSRNISAKAWAAVHNPGHGRLSIKMFAAASSRAGLDKDRRDDEPFSSLEDFKTALRAACLAVNLAMPWNHSVTAIEGFLHSTKYGFKYFHNARDHIRQLTAFVDLCFEENARRWNLRRPFLVNTDLTNEWNVFTAALGAAPSASNQRQQAKRPRSPAERRQSPQRPKWDDDSKVCFRYNEAYCRNPEMDCRDMKGDRLRHICSVRIGRNGARCGKRHPAKNHKF